MRKLIQCVVFGAVVNVVFFLVPPQEARATTIVVIRTHKEVVLATDSKATYEGGDAPENAGPVSKIYGMGDLFFAVSGLAEDPETKFTVPGIVAEASRGLSTVAEKVKAIEARLETALVTEVPKVRERDPDLYQKLVSGKWDVLSLVVVGLEKGVPFARGMAFSLNSSPDGLRASLKENSCPGDCLFGVKTLWLGQSDEIAKYMEGRRSPRKPVADFARFLIQLEIDAKAEGVGGPIDIVRITSTGAEWVQRKPDCPQILP